MPVSAGEHRAIVRAIASGDPDAAARAMFGHVMQSKERTLANHLRRRPADKLPKGIAIAARQRAKLPAA
jgi:DNA-binding FadR family transcriptional regulator